MKPRETRDLEENRFAGRKLQELNKTLEFAQQIDQKIQEFNISSAQVAEKWQKKAENKVKQDES